MDNNIIFLFKNKKFKKIINLIKKSEITDLDIKDENNNYFINYLINDNNLKLLKVIFKLCIKKSINLRIDILDNDNRIILYNCIKFNYIDVLTELLLYNKKCIGLSIINIKDTFGNISLNYSIIFNNYNAFIILLENNSNPYIINNIGDNAFYICIKSNNIKMLEYLLNNYNNLNFTNINGDTLLHTLIENISLNLFTNYEDIIDLLINKLKNLNNNNNIGITVLHQSILNNVYDIFNKLLKKNININLTDFYGNTALHYIISDIEKYIDYLNNLLSFDNINYNISNIYGDIPLHILLNLNINITLLNKNLIDKIVYNSDLNILNNNNESCLYLIVKKDLLLYFKDILIYKPLYYNIDKNISDSLLNILCDSYYNLILNNKNNLKLKWEIDCLNIKNKDKCYKNIKSYILKSTQFIPYFKKFNIILDNDIILDNYCYYTGLPIDILSGLLLLNNKFKKNKLSIILKYPLTINNNITNFNDKLDFINIEILWYYQKIYFPTYFDNEIINKIKIAKYIVIPIGIINSIGCHANILFWDIDNNTIERFEPSGANYPINFNYNPILLDTLLEQKFKSINDNIIYYSPNKYLPIIGFQYIENIESNCIQVGDPNGFCGVWCIWWIYQRMLNINNNKLNIFNIANELIKYIKYDNMSFKLLIRNFSNKITKIRNSYINKYNLSINDFYNQNYTNEIINNLEKDILKDI